VNEGTQTEQNTQNTKELPISELSASGPPNPPEHPDYNIPVEEKQPGKDMPVTDNRTPITLRPGDLGVFGKVKAPIHEETKDILKLWSDGVFVPNTFTIEDIARSNRKKGAKQFPLIPDYKPAFQNAAQQLEKTHKSTGKAVWKKALRFANEEDKINKNPRSGQSAFRSETEKWQDIRLQEGVGVTAKSTNYDVVVSEQIHGKEGTKEAHSIPWYNLKEMHDKTMLG